MIYLYTGTPGSGKSYHAAEVVDRALRKRIPVIANFEINRNPRCHKGEFVYIPTLEMSVDFFEDYARQHFQSNGNEHQGIIIIDEAQIPFNAREGLNRNRMRWLEFFSQHRHYYYDIILITQNDRMLDRQIRSLVETEYKHRKLTNYGAKGWFMIVLFRKMFVGVQYWYPIQERVGAEFFNLRRRVCRLYDTFGKFDKPERQLETADESIKSRVARYNGAQRPHANGTSEEAAP